MSKIVISIIMLTGNLVLSHVGAYNFKVQQATPHTMEHSNTLTKSIMDRDIPTAAIVQLKGLTIPQISTSRGFVHTTNHHVFS